VKIHEARGIAGLKHQKNYLDAGLGAVPTQRLSIVIGAPASDVPVKPRLNY